MTFTIVSRAKRLRQATNKLYINGTWSEPESDEIWPHIHPATGESAFGVAVASARDVDHAVRAARRAFDQGPWGRMSARERKLLLRPIGDLIRGGAAELHELQTLDNSIPISFGNAYRVSADMAADIFEYHIGWIDKLDGSAPPVFSDSSPIQSITIKEAVGVVAAITPFNAPVLQFIQKIGPALSAGCTIVIKPSEFATGVALKYTELIDSLDLPPGVFNLITGLADTGAALVEHPLVDKISFTGRRSVGKKVLHAAANGIKRVALELGGKSPSIVFDDVADLDTVARTAMSMVSMGLSGQVCSTQTRSLVHESVYDEFVDAALRQLGDVHLGDPFDPATTSAPMISRPQVGRVLDFVTQAVNEGATLVAGGGTPSDPDLSNGNWVEPTLVTHVDKTARIAREEIFGPVLSVIRFKDEDEAIELANDSPFGLSAGIYTGSASRALRVARALRVGTVGIGGGFYFMPSTQFGGYKESGIGREGGREGIEQYLETKTITIPLDT